MSYFLSDQNLRLNTEVIISGPEAAHILLSRRIKLGEKIVLQDGNAKRFLCEVLAANKKTLTVRPVQEVSVPQELSTSLALYQSVVSEKALDFIFQKATELGASEIVLFNSTNTATKLTQLIFNKKLDRWSKILWEAAKQSGRSKIPDLKFLPALDNVVGDAKRFEKFLVLDASGASLKSKITNLKSIALIVGPEGGLIPLELDQLQSAQNSQLVSISPFVLRAETAAIAGLAIIQNQI
jgi:16S rRNA (uracil1498-N3)-methyltransferase